MKTTRWVVMGLLLVGSADFSRGATNEVSALLQKGLFEEEANRNLDAAIQAYQAVITQTEKDRQFAATALFRLGECYRKLGKTNEANVAYQRVVREFPDQTELAKLSQGYLGAAGSSAGATSAEAFLGTPEQVEFLKKQQAEGEAFKRQQADSAEAAEVKRIQAMIKDSPDLINAYDEHLRTPLHEAAWSGQLTVVRFLLDNKAELETKTKDNERATPLLLAVRMGRKETVELLLNSGANVNATANDGNTSLHIAASRGDKAIAEDLLAHGANVNARGNSGYTPLHYAAQRGFKTVTELLLGRGADVNIKNNDGATALDAAVSAGNKVIAELLLANKADVNIQSKDGSTPLIHAVSANQLEAARMLLEHGAEVNAGMVSAGHNGKWTALFEAVSRNENDLVKLLLEHGADPNATADEIRQYNTSGFGGGPGSSYSTTLLPNSTPLMLAVRWDRKETAAILLAHKADVNLQDATGESVLAMAVRSKEMVSLLLENKANVNAANNEGYTPLMAAVGSGQSEIAEMLLAHGADINARIKTGSTALHQAVANGSKPMVELLLAHKAEPNIKNNDGNTPLDLMARANNPGFSPGGLNFQNGTIPMMVPGSYPGLPGGMPGRPGGANAGGGPEEISALLREHGAVGEIERSTIRIGRQGQGEPRIVFRKDANSFNHFTLFELIVAQYPNPNSFAYDFPDFTKVSVQHGVGTGTSRKAASTINLLNETNGFDCAKDMLLEFGDVVEIPERDHTLGEPRSGTTPSQNQSLKDCVKGKLKLIVNGQAKEFDMWPGFETYRLESFLQFQEVRNILRSSSDLTHITVKRVDPVTKKSREVTVNSRDQKSVFDDVWLRDGDVIEVPEVR